MQKICRVDPRLDQPKIEVIRDHIQNRICVPVRKKQPQYKFNCMMGEEHPLSIEVDNYTLLTIATTTLDQAQAHQAETFGAYEEFSQNEMEFFASIMRRPEIEWAVDNSFDGLYIYKGDDYASFAMQYKFAVYLKSELATFWKLKFSGR